MQALLGINFNCAQRTIIINFYIIRQLSYNILVNLSCIAIRQSKDDFQRAGIILAKNIGTGDCNDEFVRTERGELEYGATGVSIILKRKY